MKKHKHKWKNVAIVPDHYIFRIDWCKLCGRLRTKNWGNRTKYSYPRGLK